MPSVKYIPTVFTSCDSNIQSPFFSFDPVMFTDDLMSILKSSANLFITYFQSLLSKILQENISMYFAFNDDLKKFNKFTY